MKTVLATIILAATFAATIRADVSSVKRILKLSQKTFNNEIKKIDEEMKGHKEEPTSWLPKVDFKRIYNHTNKNAKAELETKYKYALPDLYKSFMDYYYLFQKFQHYMVINFPDTPKSYLEKRKQFLERNFARLEKVLDVVDQDMIKFNFPLGLKGKVHDLSPLPTEIEDMSECLKLDFLAFKGYENLLANWLSELQCMEDSKNPDCKQWEKKLKTL